MTALLAEELGGEEFGQYAWDRATAPEDSRIGSDPTGTKGLRGNGLLGLHEAETLFDEASGILPDERTGLPLATKDKDPEEYEYVRTGGLSIVDAVDAEIARRRPVRLSAKELGEAWLREHDPDNPRYKPKKDAKVGAK